MKEIFGGYNFQTVSRIPHCESFEQFVKTQLNLVRKVQITKGTYLALPKEQRNEWKATDYITPASFKTSPANRRLENAKDIQLVFLDIDEGAGPWAHEPEKLERHLEPFSWALYRTASSTRDCPRVRLVVDAERLSLGAYRDAVDTFASILDAKLGKESYVPVQAMYLPILFEDESDHPLLHYALGQPFTEKDIKLVERQTKKPEDDELDYLSPIVEGITTEQVKELLGYLDPDCNYHEWIEVAMALKHQFQSRQRQGYLMFDAWSSKGSKYKGSEETLAKWRSTRVFTRGRYSITLRTLLERAKDKGWDPSSISDFVHKAKHIIDDCLTEIDLTRSIRRIAALPSLTPLQLTNIMGYLKKTAQDKFKVTYGISDLKKEYEIQRKLLGQDNTPEKLDAWIRGICYVGSSNQFYIVSTGEKLIPEAMEKTFGRRMKIDPATGRRVGVCEYLLNVVNIPTVYRQSYRPDLPNQTIFQQEDNSQLLVNSYSPPSSVKIDPSSRTLGMVGSRILTHMENLIIEPEYRELLLSFFAYLIQEPGKKIRWAPVIQGKQGGGKSFLHEMMSAALGKRNCLMVPGSQLYRDFNPWAENAQLTCFEEVYLGGRYSRIVADKLKVMIANSSVYIDDKHEKGREVENRTNYIFFTNRHNPIPVSETSRRYFYIESRIQADFDIAQLGANYFRKLYAIIHHPFEIAEFFRTYDISRDFNPNGHAVRTTYLTESIDETNSDMADQLAAAVENETHPLVSKEIVSLKIARFLLHELTGRPPNRREMIAWLRQHGYHRLGEFPIGPDRQNHKLYCMPRLKAHRKELVDAAAEYLKTGDAHKLDKIVIHPLLR